MRSSRKPLVAAKLYLILDTDVLPRPDLLRVLKDAVRSGVDIVQLRDKKSSAKEILGFCRQILKVTRHQIPFIVNDRVDMALISGADGVHLGQDDIGCLDARRLMGPDKIIGISCQSLEASLKAQREKVDYIGFGSVFKTKTKPNRLAMDLDFLTKALSKVKVPLFAIGGVSRRNVGQLISLGVTRVAVCRDILLADDVRQATRELKSSLT